MSAAPKKILIIAVPGFGDVLLCTPLISAVRSAWPGAELHVLVRGKVSGVLEGNPDVDEVIEAVNRAGVRETLALLRPRFREYDLVLSNYAAQHGCTLKVNVGAAAHDRRWRHHWHAVGRLHQRGDSGTKSVGFDHAHHSPTAG